MVAMTITEQSPASSDPVPPPPPDSRAADGSALVLFAGMTGVEVAGVYDVREERAGAVGRRWGVPVRRSLEELLDHADAIVVSVPTTAHEEVALPALERGVHVLVEKPLAPTLGGADRILEAAERSGARVQTGHVERFNPAVRAAERFLDRPLFVESHRMAPFTQRSADIAVVLDLMIHDVDLVMSLVGTPPVEIAAVGVPVLSSSIDIASARLTFRGGAVANLTASRVSVERTRKIRIFQRSGYVSLDLAEGTGEFLRLRRALPALAERGAATAQARGVLSPADRARSGEAPRTVEALAEKESRTEEEVRAPGVQAGSEAARLPGVLAELLERVPLAGDGEEPLRRELENFRDVVRGGAEPVVSGRAGREALAVALAIQERIEGNVTDSRPAQA